MKILAFGVYALFAATASAGERCIAIDGDTLACNHRKFRLSNVYADDEAARARPLAHCQARLSTVFS